MFIDLSCCILPRYLFIFVLPSLHRADMNPCTYTVSLDAPLVRAYQLVRQMGLRHLVCGQFKIIPSYLTVLQWMMRIMWLV